MKHDKSLSRWLENEFKSCTSSSFARHREGKIFIGKKKSWYYYYTLNLKWTYSLSSRKLFTLETTVVSLHGCRHNINYYCSQLIRARVFKVRNHVRSFSVSGECCFIQPFTTGGLIKEPVGSRYGFLYSLVFLSPPSINVSRTFRWILISPIEREKNVSYNCACSSPLTRIFH